MPSIYNLKSRFQQLLRPLVSRLAVARITPNQVTLAALLLSVFSGIAIALWPHALWPLWCVPFVLFIRMALNAIDGMLAREHQMQSPLGAVLNELGDVLSDTALYLPFAFLPSLSATLVVLVVILASWTEMAGVIAVQIGAKRRYDGPMGKSDRAFAFGLLALMLGAGFSGEGWSSYYLCTLIILLLITLYNRVQGALKELHA